MLCNLFVISPNSQTYAQTIEIDSLKNSLKDQNRCSAEWLTTQTTAASKVIYFDITEAQKRIDSVLSSPKDCRDKLPKSFGKPFLVKSWCFQGRGKLDSAITYALMAKEYANRYPDKNNIEEITVNLASMLVQSGNPHTLDSLEKWNSQLEKYDPDKRATAFFYGVWSDYYTQQGDYTKAYGVLKTGLNKLKNANPAIQNILTSALAALSYYTKNHSAAISIAKDELRNGAETPIAAHVTRDFLASSFLQIGMPDSAIFYLQENIKTKISNLVCNTHSTLARAYFDIDSLKKAYHHIKYSDSLYQILEKPGGHKLVLITRAEIENALGLYKARDKSIKRHDETPDNLNTSQLAYTQSRLKFELLDKLKSQDLKATFNKYDSVRRKQIQEKSAIQTSYLIEEYRLSEKQLKIAELEQKRELDTAKAIFRNQQIFGLGILSLFLLGISFQLYKSRSEVKAREDSIKNLNIKLFDQVKLTDSLNRELNHRTANQISLAYELILDQRRQIGDEQAKASLERSESQLMALREVNRALAHRSDDLVRADEVLTKVAKNLQAASPYPFELDLQLEAISVHGNAASRSALILAELLSNSIKYAFPNTENAKATISLSQSEEGTTISYSDNGPGADGTIKGTGVGSGLIEAMLEDLDAKFEEGKNADGKGYGIRWWWGD